MCGIAGVQHLDPIPIASNAMARMVAMLRHRGPDAEGIFLDGPTALGHTRLSIVDLSGGRQPMQSRDGALTITFNGEIYNHPELRNSLTALGHRFATRSDTEVILHAYEQYGDACVDHFNGQWAFALWDRRRQRLLLSRDRLGIRPLFHATVANKFLFASEVKALLTDPDVPREIDLLGLDQLFTFWAPLAPRTIFRGIEELPPGHNMAVEQGRVRVWPYWRPEFNHEFEPVDRAHQRQWAEALLDLLADATQLRLRADVPVGAYLSGGLDSSITTALARQCTSGPLRTFSITFDEAEFDEAAYQRELVDHLGTDHQSFRCTHEAIAKALPEVVWHAERPMVRTAPAPLYWLSRQVRDAGYKVVLTGEGADEMLGGYDIFKEAKVRRFWAAQPDSTFRAALLGRLYPYLPNLRSQSPAYRAAFFHVRPEDLADPLFSHLPRCRMTAGAKRFFAPEVQAALAEYDALADCRTGLPRDFHRWRPFCQAQYLETTILMPGYILSSQGDRMAMAHSVEGRFPFLDYRLAEFAARIPPRLKMKGLREKHLLKQAAGHLVPPSVVERPKQPYRAPDAAALFRDGRATADYIDELLSPRRIRDAGLFHPQAVEALVRKAQAGRLLGQKDNMSLVGVLTTQLVVDRFLGDTDTCFPRLENPHERDCPIPANLC